MTTKDTKIEDVPMYEVINSNISLTEVRNILESYLYDKNDNCIGRLCDFHLKYDVNGNRMLGINSV